MKQTKLFHAFDDKPPIEYRPNTSDEAIIDAVIVKKQEYAFPNFKPNLIFDIGGNIGVVAVVLANIYPDAKIYSFEPVKENFDILKRNTEYYKNISAIQCGLGNKTEHRMIFKSSDPSNLGGFSTFIKDGGENSEIALVKMETICNEFGTPDLIKIDVEGAEYEILGDIPDIENVKWIAGELHGVNDYKLLDLLDKKFNLQLARNFMDKVWHFHAVSKNWTHEGPDRTLP